MNWKGFSRTAQECSRTGLFAVRMEHIRSTLQHRFTLMVSEVEALHQVVSLAAGRTLGVTPCPRRGGGDGRGGNDGFGSG